MNKKGFVLIETIVVVLALCILLVTLYSSYSNIILAAKNDSEYDNTEYIYKTLLVKNCFINLNIAIPDDYVICENNCQEKNYSQYYNELVNILKIKSIYIMPWNKNEIDEENKISKLLATTQKYYRNLDPKSCPGCQRIIVMFEDENANNNYTFQYASLKYEVEDE